MPEVLWTLDNLQAIGGNPIEVLGAPVVVDTPLGKALAFNGESDGLIVHANPLTGAAKFTVEAVFRPAPGGMEEQRFLHVQPDDRESRILLETRLPSGGGWFLDAFIKSGDASCTLYAEAWKHPLAEWQHAALVYDGDVMSHYVNGLRELSDRVRYRPTRGGATSIGVRMNRVYWYRGLIRLLRFTPSALSLGEFLSLAT